jgi:predicted metal-binding membrane protein
MCCELAMPGGWTMSMMWLRMPGHTWFASAVSFLFMWLAMMVAMMLPSALPTFLKTKRRCTSLCCMASGYFAIWFAAGIGVYVVGVAFGAVAIRWELFSRAAPGLLGASLIAAGVIQFTRWKMTHLLRCRSQFGCAIPCADCETSFRLGFKQGAACCLCCAAPMTIMIVLGMMNPLLMIGIAMIIAAEKILPRPEVVARIVGVVTLVAGIIVTVRQSLGA